MVLIEIMGFYEILGFDLYVCNNNNTRTLIDNKQGSLNYDGKDAKKLKLKVDLFCFIIY